MIVQELLVVTGLAMSIGVFVFGLRRGFSFMNDLVGEPPAPVVPVRVSRDVPLLRQDANLVQVDTAREDLFREIFEAIDRDTPVPEVQQLPELPPRYGAF